MYFEQLHPFCKQVVYAFHMPVFLILSGYLMNIEKGAKKFARTIMYYALPYLLIESGYIVMASALPIREHISELTPTVFLSTLLTRPIGPYWYLHAIIVFGVVYYSIFKIKRANFVSRIILCGIIVVALSVAIKSFTPYHAVFFFAGATLRHCKANFVSAFRPSILAPVALVLLALCPRNLVYGAVGQLFVVYASVSPRCCF